MRDGGFVSCMNRTTEDLRVALAFALMVDKLISSVFSWIVADEVLVTLHCKCLVYFILQACQILWYEAVAFCSTWPIKTKTLPIQEVIFLPHGSGRAHFLLSSFTSYAKNLISNCIMQKRITKLVVHKRAGISERLLLRPGTCTWIGILLLSKFKPNWPLSSSWHTTNRLTLRG